MRGVIRSYDSTTGTGTITGEDGFDYVFGSGDIHSGSDIDTNRAVDFVPQGSAATSIVVINPVAAEPPASGYDPSGASSDQPRGEDPFDVQRALVSFEGRLRRKHFWYSWLILLGASVVAGWIPLLGPIIGLVLIWPNLAITVKRLHDMGRTGWLALVPMVGTTIAMVIAIMGGAGAYLLNMAEGDTSNASAATILGSFGLSMLIVIIVNLGFMLWIGITDSQPGPNRFGHNPKGIG